MHLEFLNLSLVIILLVHIHVQIYDICGSRRASLSFRGRRDALRSQYVWERNAPILDQYAIEQGNHTIRAISKSRVASSLIVREDVWEVRS